MENGKNFNGSIVIADPCYFMKSDEDCQLVFDCDTKGDIVCL